MSLDLHSLAPDPVETQADADAQNVAGYFAQAYNSTLDSVTGQQSGLPGALGAQVKMYCWEASRAAETGIRSLQTALGMPREIPVSDPSTREIRRGRTYPEADRALAYSAMSYAVAEINRLEQEAQQEAARLVAEVFRASAQTDLPKYGASETRQAELKQDIVGLLDSARSPRAIQETAQNLINKLVAEDDQEALSVLLGPRMELARQRLGLDYDALCRQVFAARMEKVGGNVHALGAPKYARFLAAQTDPHTSLGAVAANAAARLRHTYHYVKQRTGR